MAHPTPQIYCTNPLCEAPLNELGAAVCASCQTPLTYRYLWAVGEGVEQIPVATQLVGRYYVTAPCIWLDTQPSLPPDIPDQWPDQVAAYLHLYRHRLHVPQVYGFCPATEEIAAGSVLLLENIPVDAGGLLAPAIARAWPKASPVRQLYWLWQILQLWEPLKAQGAATSVLALENIRVNGWRVRLCRLFHDADVVPEGRNLSLADLATRWMSWLDQGESPVAEPMRELCKQMRQPKAELAPIAARLNQMLLEAAAQLPLRLAVAGGTDTGKEPSHNEDNCYPQHKLPPEDRTAHRVAIVCDGIGGHEGGEVASQLAVNSLKLQAQAFLGEIALQTELMAPELVVEQLEASLRVVNNLIASQNDTQGRADRRRMGTTLVMALQVPQRLPVETENGSQDSHELYLVNVGDSRAYWITPRTCVPLTVDDDVATREVQLGRSLLREARLRPDGAALTQAIGTRDASQLHPSIQRLILEEDGLLLLCSDGLSDNDLVEQHWQTVTAPFFKGNRTLEETVQAWIVLANQHNGYDNTSVVLMHCRVSSAAPDVTLPRTQTELPQSAWSPASEALAAEAGDAAAPEAPVPATAGQRGLSGWGLALLVALLLGVSGGVGLAVWQTVNPQGFETWRDRVWPFSTEAPAPPPN